MTTVINGSSNINLDFSTGGRITGDFSNATIANRALFQSSTTNGGTYVTALPNGTGTASGFFTYNNSDSANSSYLWTWVNGSTDVQIRSGIAGTGTYLPMTFYTGGSERMRVDTSGNVLVGTTTSRPATSSVASGGFTAINNGAASPTIQWLNSNAGTDLKYWRVQGGSSGQLSFQTVNDVYTAATDRLTIDSSGNLLVNTTSPIGTGPTVVFKGPATAGQQQLSLHNPATAGTRFFQTFGTEASYTERGYITWNGSTMALSNASDERLKKNIVNAPSALPKIAELKIRSFDFKEDDRHVDYGVIAQELDDVIPSAVFKGSETEDGAMDKPWSVGLEPLIPVLIKAIQEQQALIEQLRADVETLKAAK